MITWQRIDEVPPKYPDEDEHPSLTKIREMWDRGDFDKLDRMVKFWEALEMFGRAGDLMRRVVIWFGVMFAAWFAFSEYIVKSIRSIAGGQ